MDVAYISALSALAGSVIGGLTSGITTWLNQCSLGRAGQLAHELSRRQELYKNLFHEAATRMMGAFESRAHLVNMMAQRHRRHPSS
jgi:hypothetical protein